LSKKKNNKEKPYLKLIRKSDNMENVHEDWEFDMMKTASFKERMSWRGIEAKTVMLGLTSLSILAAVIVFLGLAATLSLIQ
jgi:hypothetical protein